jgi:hypothetical protein
MTQEGAVPPNFIEQIRRIAQEEVAKLARSATLRNASISKGGRLTIKGGAIAVEAADGGLTFFVGGITPSLPDGTYQPGMTLRREDGTLAMALYDPDPDPDGPGDYKQFLALYDRGQRIIMSDDTASGQGLARPWLGATFYRERYADWIGTTSTTWETLFTAYLYKQHPELFVQMWTSNDTPAATGEVRVLVNDVPFGTPAATGFVVSAKTFGAEPVSGSHMGALEVQIQARVVSGGGAVRVEPINCLGVQSL